MEFAGGQQISWSLPRRRVSGLLTGDRTIKYHGLMTFVDPVNRIKALVKIGDNSEKKGGFMGIGCSYRSDIVKGKIYRYNPEVGGKQKENKKSQDKEDWKMEDLVEDLLDIDGSWVENLRVGGEEVWNLTSMRPSVHVPQENPLSSDPRFRADLVWLTHAKQVQSEIRKARLEER